MAFYASIPVNSAAEYVINAAKLADEKNSANSKSRRETWNSVLNSAQSLANTALAEKKIDQEEEAYQRLLDYQDYLLSSKTPESSEYSLILLGLDPSLRGI